MLAFLLGFTFAHVAAGFREAQAALHRESDAIAEAHRWGQLLAEADRRWLQESLRAYTDLLLHPDATEAADREVRSAQAKLWAGLAARRAAATERSPYDPCLRAVNQFIQSYDLRYHLSRRRLPDMVVLFTLGAPLLIGFLVGYTSELPPKHFRVLAVLFVIFLTAIIYLIWELDRPGAGLITISRQSLIDLVGRLRESPP
jgi:hypothetical protein